MTTTQSGSQADVAPADLVEVTIDGVTTHVAKGTLIIRAAEQIGIAIPRFCDHPLLAPAGACRQCLVEVAMPGRDGNLAAMPKPQASCTMEVTAGMVVKTQLTSPVAETAQHGVMEFLLINHPLDCPVCDKGGECPLQNQAMSNGRATSRFHDVKRTYAKPLAISTQVLLDRERCILCQRCTRFSAEIAGDPFIDLQMRGAAQQIGRFDEQVLGFEGELPRGEAQLDTSGRPFSSYFSGNTIQICPVGALTSAAYRFRSRPFDLVSTPSIAEHDACGSAIRIDHRRGVVLRRLAGDDPAVNEEWISDKDRFAFRWQTMPDRLEAPLVREDDALIPTSWPDAFHTAATALAGALARGPVAALPGGRVTVEDAHAWGAFARTVLGTNDVDFRARTHSAEEADFLAASVAGAGVGVTYADLERAGFVLLAGLEPEEEAATIFLRLRKGVLAGRVQVATLAPLVSRGASKLRARWLPAAPGTEAEVLDALSGADLGDDPSGAVVLVGERLGAVPGALSAVARLAQRTGARVAWVPRRAGDRGAVEAGLLPTLLPGGRPVADDAARADAAARWGVPSLPSEPGRDLTGILAAAQAGELAGLVVGGLDLEDLPDPAAARAALEAVRASGGVVVQLEVRRSAVTPFADVVLPVAPPVEKAGTFLTWEGRPRSFGAVFDTAAFSDAGVLTELAAAMGRALPAPVWPAWTGARALAPAVPAPEPVAPPAGHVVLATWRLLLDAGRGQDGEPHLAGTAHRPVARLAPGTAEALGLADASEITVRGPRGAVTLPLVLVPMAEHVVWLPQHAPGVSVHSDLGAGAGDVVEVVR
ncbi:NADH-quinone oxidoreductase, chain G [Beutenbergia cavernae DSM 12333]|uniref:NADH-quinone oxidoreductase, chain G n=1 Tax=Beutenbergia cavernae (strain ATCC BAA-8 / DSM 12333 / CCUG 43141 / JCM 11478 / NBRC 16432 / NCIMB 13614 / HKI 0122) TaxID=471853 RepID=C5C0S1_BEUC1|nr:NADH-quinone oxidoreductase subunit G [Beutenbergia cavernae]ACQ81467.1 NADH-quinone oxidoreductase, chain G [Beutenbergia cavernae DSM 12333]